MVWYVLGQKVLREQAIEKVEKLNKAKKQLLNLRQHSEKFMETKIHVQHRSNKGIIAELEKAAEAGCEMLKKY